MKRLTICLAVVAVILGIAVFQQRHGVGEAAVPDAAPEPLTADFAIIRPINQWYEAEAEYLVKDPAELQRLLDALADAAPLKQHPKRQVTLVEGGIIKSVISLYSPMDYFLETTVPYQMLAVVGSFSDDAHAVHGYGLCAQDPMEMETVLARLATEQDYTFYCPVSDRLYMYSSLDAYYTYYGERPEDPEAEAAYWHAPIGVIHTDDVLIPMRDWLQERGLLHQAGDVGISHYSPAREGRPEEHGRWVKCYLTRPLTRMEQAELKKVLADATGEPPYCSPEGEPSGSFRYDAAEARAKAPAFYIVMLSASPVPDAELDRLCVRYRIERWPPESEQ